jgi:hypothetical protein
LDSEDDQAAAADAVAVDDSLNKPIRAYLAYSISITYFSTFLYPVSPGSFMPAVESK